MDIMCILLELAEQGALYKKHRVTTTALSKKMNTTQQTMSNILKKLEDENYIQRETSLRGLDIAITRKGKEFLMDHKRRLDTVFEKSDKLKGKVVTGLGEGKFYIQQKEYMSQFKELLGMKPYPGTLNMLVGIIDKNKFLNDKKPIIIKGFETEERTFGSIECYPIMIGKIHAAIIIPKRTHHNEKVLEIISDKNLREELKIKDKDEVIVNETG